MMAATDLLNAVSTHANYPSKPLTWFLSNQLLTEEKLKSQFVVVLTSSTSRFLVVLKTQFRKVPPVLCEWAFFKINKLLFFQSMPHIYIYIYIIWGFPLYNRLVESYQNSLFSSGFCRHYGYCWWIRRLEAEWTPNRTVTLSFCSREAT